MDEDTQFPNDRDSMIKVIVKLRSELSSARGNAKFWQGKYLELHKKIEGLGLYAGQVLNQFPPQR